MDTVESAVHEKIYGIVATIIGVPRDSVTEDSSPDSLRGWDSLRHMKLILAVEEMFDVQLTDEEIVSITDVRSIVALVGQKGSVGS
jgi:acyl carrier protein